jgi:hypothetical protein
MKFLHQCLVMVFSKVWSLPPLPQVILIFIIELNYTGEQNLQAWCRKHTDYRARNCDQLLLNTVECVGIAQWLQRLDSWLEHRGNWVWFQATEETVVFYSASRPTPGPTQSSVQWIPMDWIGVGVQLTIHHYLLSRLISGRIPPLPTRHHREDCAF